ncbi:MAG: LPS export ABC transporter permease LptG [candidate division KSB1 bacterium]|nr:LPS export ABC transporter permease LptG [candidate division KSB1 bacterium]MDZ7384951.1 LPS export ABC transporter permease LptG [candidate division KSB1 bacterium]MDZ7391874.1 LPS export ABC transporter permease LptG [candidate division KSB1 bacterium]MDZ7413246.1 LPS export ABC transporter permease LptG [candidate division KSB1 bacterium]
MRILDRYIARRFLSNLAFALVAFALIFIIVDLVEQLDAFLDRNVPWSIVAKYYLLYLPFIVVMSLPVAVLLASLFCMGTLAKHNELVAMKANGISLYRLLLPMVVLGIVVSLADLFVGEVVAPAANRRKREIKLDYIEKHDFNVRRRMTNLIVRDRADRRLLIRYYDSKQRIAYRVTIQEYQGSTLRRRLDAPLMRWTGGCWRMENGYEREFSALGEHALAFTTRDVVDLKLMPEELARIQLEPEEMSYGELRRFIDEVRRNGGKPHRWLVDLHLKLAFPFSNLIILLIGAALASSKRRSGVTIGFGFSLVICFLYFGLMKMGQSLGHTGTLPPALAAWLGNMVFLLVSIVLVARTRT